MCHDASVEEDVARFVRYKKGKQLEKDFLKSFRVNAFTNPRIPITIQDNPEDITTGIWGLVPFWGKSDPKKFLSRRVNTNNARGEALYETKSYKGEVDKHRCIIYFDGFFEPHWYNSKEQQPYYCYIPKEKDYKEREVLQIAGIYSQIDDEYYVSLVTTEANDFFAEVHNKKKRMPLVLDDNLVKEWIAPEQSKSVIDDLVHDGFTHKDFKAHPVENIYSRSYDKKDIEIITPVEPLRKLD